MPMFQLSDATKKIETVLFPKIAKGRNFLTPKSRCSAISRPIFASVHGPLGKMLKTGRVEGSITIANRVTSFVGEPFYKPNQLRIFKS